MLHLAHNVQTFWLCLTEIQRNNMTSYIKWYLIANLETLNSLVIFVSRMSHQLKEVPIFRGWNLRSTVDSSIFYDASSLETVLCVNGCRCCPWTLTCHWRHSCCCHHKIDDDNVPRDGLSRFVFLNVIQILEFAENVAVNKIKTVRLPYSLFYQYISNYYPNTVTDAKFRGLYSGRISAI